MECINPVSTNSDIIEFLFIEIICKFNKNIIMRVIYHPPDTDADNFTTELDKLITTLTFAKNKNIFLADDFNTNLFNTDKHQPTKLFLEMMLSNYLLPLTCHPTRVTSTSSTLIDNIFTNVTAKCERSAIVYSDVSDHFPIAIRCNPSTKHKISIPIRKLKFNTDNMDKFKNLLSLETWGSVFDACNNKNPDLGYYCHFMEEVYLNLFNKLFPVIET